MPIGWKVNQSDSHGPIEYVFIGVLNQILVRIDDDGDVLVKDKEDHSQVFLAIPRFVVRNLYAAHDMRKGVILTMSKAPDTIRQDNDHFHLVQSEVCRSDDDKMAGICQLGLERSPIQKS